MADNDINIHVKAQGAGQAKTDIDQTKRSIESMGQSVDQAGRTADQAKSKFDIFGKVIGRLRSEVVGLITSWLSISAVIRLIDAWNDKLARLRDLMKENYDASLRMQDVGQRIEIQTGTVGQQKDWAKKAISLQTAGGIRDIETAEAMVVAANKVYSPIGGMKNKEVQRMLASIAPYFGMTQAKPDDVQKIFEEAVKQQVAPTPQAMWDYLSGGKTSLAVAQAQAYMRSGAAGRVGMEAKKQAWQLETGQQVAPFEEEVGSAEQQFSELLLAGKDMPGVPDAYEKYVILAKNLRGRLSKMKFKGQAESQRVNLIKQIDTYEDRADWYSNPLRAALGSTFPDQEFGNVRQFYGAYTELVRQNNPAAIHYHNDVVYNKTPPPAEPRVTPGSVY